MKRMRISAGLGISIAIGAIFRFAAMEFLQHKSYYEAYRWPICLGFLALGAMVWPMGLNLNARRAQKTIASRESRDSMAEDEGDKPAPPFLLFNLSYWGAMLAGFGLILFFVTPMLPNKAQTVAARTVSTNDLAAPPHPKPAPKAAFPPSLKLQGLTYRQSNPSALINGRTYFVGEYLGNVKLVAIDAQQVVLELEGQQKVLVLDK